MLSKTSYLILNRGVSDVRFPIFADTDADFCVLIFADVGCGCYEFHHIKVM